jgi:hypothetical protein
MSTDGVGVVAGMLSTTLFVLSYLPMLVKAFRTRDLSSYSPGYLVLANVGNLIHSVYVASLPFGPIWFLHGFYTASSAIMLCWYLRYHPRHALNLHGRRHTVAAAVATSAMSRGWSSSRPRTKAIRPAPRARRRHRPAGSHRPVRSRR